VEDRIRGNIVFDNNELDDFIIARSDGMPTYNLAVVVDDITMNVNTILRGDDHISNTPKQIQLYNAFGAAVPVFGHVPMVLGHDRTRLSKRHGAMSVTAYRDMGYHPEAMINFLVRLGWSHGDQEFFTRQELVEKFNLAHIGKAAGVFNPEKLLALNAEHIRASSDDVIAAHLLPFLNQKGINAEPGQYLNGIIGTLKPRSKTFIEMADGAEFYFQEKVILDEAAAAKFLTPSILDALKEIAHELASAQVFDQPSLEKIFTMILEKTGLKFGKIAQPLRVALTGKTVSPGIFEMMEALGKEKVLTRINKAIDYIERSSVGS
jgi:glutamyl-tRNA synthetase